MSTAKRFEDLDVWQRTRELTNVIYGFSSSGIFSKDYGLRDQIRRAAVAVMSNIAEGFESQTQAIFIQYLESQPNARRMREDGVSYDVRQ
jgi:hypothetical protein